MGQSKPFKLKILVVDDDEEVLAVVSAMLEAEGHDVLTAANTHDALALLDAQRDIALLFTDIVLPGPMDGFDLAETAKVRRPDLRVIYTSGYLKNEGVWEARLLPKPWTVDDLRSVLAELYGVTRPNSPPPDDEV